MMDLKFLEVGFGDLTEFLDYTEQHSMTHHALFTVDHLNLLYEVAGSELRAPGLGGSMTAMFYNEAMPLVQAARKREYERELAERPQVIGFCGPHRTGKTYLARQVVSALRAAGREAELVPSPVSATFKRLGLDPSQKLDFDTRLWAQHNLITAFQDLLAETVRDSKNITLVFDRTPLDFSGYMTADYLDGSLSSKQIEKLGQYHSVCMSLLYNRTFNQVFLVHGHRDLPFVEEALKGRNDAEHLNLLDTVMTQITYQHSMYTQVVDMPRDVALDRRLDYVLERLDANARGAISAPV